MVELKSIFQLVDDLVNERFGSHRFVFSERLMLYSAWSDLPALEDKVAEWSKEHPVIWNSGIGPSASFVLTMTRLLFERTKDIYGPYDHIVRVRFTPAVRAGSSAAKRWLAIEALMEMATSPGIQVPESESIKLQELKQHIAEEIYFGYGALSDYLMLQAFGREYIENFGSDPSGRDDASFARQPFWSLVDGNVRAALLGKRYLLVVENTHVPVSLDVLVLVTNLRPSIYQQNRWLISTTSKDVCDQSRLTKGVTGFASSYHLSAEYYHAPPFGDLDKQEWATLIKEAIRDAAGSIHNTLQQQGRGFEFWLKVALHCLYYAVLYHPRKASTNSPVSSDELVRCWVAEDLLFSVTSPTDSPAATSKKQSNYYRSAYEAGKVVIQALQEYSLLPIYSVPNTPTTSSASGTATTPSSDDTITGVSKVAEGVPRLQQDELVEHEMSEQLRWVSFLNDDGRHICWDRLRWMKEEFIPGKMTVTTLILRRCSNTSGFPFDEVFNSHLRVLDLSYTPIYCLPSGFSQLLNLHLLSLRGCFQLETLSSTPSTPEEEETAPLAHLENLQVLDMNGVPLLQIIQQDGTNKSNLHYLDLSGSRITTLPYEFFHSMSSLEELILGNCFNLKELPPSMAELYTLQILHVEGTRITCFPEDMFQAMQRLHTLKLISNMLLMSFPRSLSGAKGLKELHIYNCISLRLQYLWELVSGLEDLYIETWKSLDNIKIQGHPNLRTFSLSGPWIRCLSLRGCSSLKTINISDDLTALENVDLSGTALEEVPHYLPNLPQLKRLILLNVPFFKRFPWHQLVRFPMVFYLDYCDDIQLAFEDDSLGIRCSARQKTKNTAQININDSRLFHSFNLDAANKLVKEGEFLQCLNVQVKPCSVRGKEPRKKEGEIYTDIHRYSPYSDVHSSEADSIMRMMELQPKGRHVEISSNNRYPDGLRHLLSVAKSIFITDDCFVRCLTELNHIMMSLEECQLMHCHKMKVVFEMHPHDTEATLYSRGRQIQMPSLKIVQVSNLNNLISLVDQTAVSYSKCITLKLLKHIHLEHCPRVNEVFPCSLSLPALETLVFLFCSNLKTIFYKQPGYEVAPSPLPNIKRVYIQELPQLQHFHDDVTFQFQTPKWEKLFVRGCHSFHRLPLLKSEYPKSKVEVSGERDWWGRLQWSLPEQSHYYLHVPPPEFLSCKKHIIRSYLR